MNKIPTYILMAMFAFSKMPKVLWLKSRDKIEINGKKGE